MNNQDSIQSAFLDRVKKSLSPNLSFADDLSELLVISRDSAYRRIRGETVLSLDEVKKICSHYKVSLDVLLSPNDEVVSFHHRRIDHKGFTFEQWLKSVLGNLEMISSFPEKEVFYAAKDIPLFHYFNFEKLSAFKMFFWMKTYHRYPEFANKKFDFNLINAELLGVGKRMSDRYSEIPCHEIWSDETALVTLRQIKYYYLSGVISKDQASELYQEFFKMIDRIKEAAANGSKGKGGFHMFKNEILLAETTILFKMGQQRVTFLTYNTMNVLTTSQESFCDHIEEFFKNLISKSLQISTTGEKERNRFFNKIQEAIATAEKRLT